MEDLEKELKDLKAEQYDMDVAFANYKEEMARKIADLGKRIQEVKGNAKEDVAGEPVVQQEPVTAEPVIQQEHVIAEPDSSVEETVQQDSTPIIPVDEPNEVTTEAPTEAIAVSTEQSEESPVIQPVVEKSEGISLTPTLDQTPLTPVGIEPISASENVTPEPVATDKKVFAKIDQGPAKAILVNEGQFNKAKASKNMQEGLVFRTEENVETNGPVIEVSTEIPTVAPPLSPVVEIPTVEQPAIAPEQNASSESVESIDEQMKAMVADLTTTTDEARANEINKNIAALNEKKMLLTKTVA